MDMDSTTTSQGNHMQCVSPRRPIGRTSTSFRRPQSKASHSHWQRCKFLGVLNGLRTARHLTRDCAKGVIGSGISTQQQERESTCSGRTPSLFQTLVLPWSKALASASDFHLVGLTQRVHVVEESTQLFAWTQHSGHFFQRALKAE